MISENPSVESLVAEAKKVYKHEFKSDPKVAVCAPGRVNLIGEHTDYNEGFVLPIALPLVTVIVGRKIEGEDTTIVTTNKDVDAPRKIIFEMPKKQALICICKPGKPKWANYIKGVIVNYSVDVPAFQAVIVSSVPTGGGISSSASLEVAIYTFLDAITGCNTVTLTEKAIACQKAEHEYAGTPCGIMDQFVSLTGQKDHAILIDCRSITSTLIPFAEPTIVILITNSNIKHELSGSEYSTRKKQCQQATLLLKKISLRDASIKDIEYLQSINAEEAIIKRAKHVVSEIERTIKAADALRDKNYNKFGELMVESHESLKNNYEVSCLELDTLVELAIQVEGVLGSRMTGGGFGGCTVTLVYKHAVDNVIQNIKNNFKGNPTFYTCKPSDGARILKLE